MYNKKKWRIITMYCRNIKEMFDELEERIEETEENNLIIGGDSSMRGRGRKEDQYGMSHGR